MSKTLANPERRLGRFQITRELIMLHWPRVAETILRGVVVVHAQCGFCADFEEVPHGSVPPFYVATVERDPMLELRVVWTKRPEDEQWGKNSDPFEIGTQNPDHGLIREGQVCEHGVRWFNACQECAHAAVTAREGSPR